MQWVKDTAERTVATWAEAFLGLLLAANWAEGIDLSVLQTAAVAAIPAGLAVLKAALASRVGSSSSASLVE